jgi:hypothetical protein
MKHLFILSCLALMITTSHAFAGEQRASVIVNAPTAIAHIYAKRGTTSRKLTSMKNGQTLALMTDCRDRKGTRIVDRWGPEFGKSGGNPKAIQALWCEVGYRTSASRPFTWGWLSGKFLMVLPIK